MPCRFLVRSAFKIPEFSCESKIKFENQSSDATRYYWDFGESGKGDTSNLDNPEHTYSRPGKYQVMLIARNGNCADTSYRSIDVYDEGVRQVHKYEKCTYDSLILAGEGLYGVKGKWSGSSEFSSINDSTIKYSGRINAGFQVAYDTNGCYLIDSHIVTIKNGDAGIERLEQPHCIGVDYTLQLGDSSRVSDVQWLIFNEDGKQILVDEHEVELTVLYNQSREAILFLDRGGCLDTLELTIDAPNRAGFDIERYNVFTPNYDQLNECWPLKVKGSDVVCKKYELTIYNRWGEKVFVHEQPEVEPCWEGTNYLTGRECPAGVYFYVARIEDYEFFGSITLIK